MSSNRGFTNINSREYTPIPNYPSHEDDDVYDYFYVLEYDLTVDPPTINWRFVRKVKKRKALGDLTSFLWREARRSMPLARERLVA